MKQDQATVRRETDIGLETLHTASQSVPKRSRGGVWTVVTTEPVGK